MSDQLPYQDLENVQIPSEGGEQNPDAAGAGRAQRSEPERSDGERRCAGHG